MLQVKQLSFSYPSRLVLSNFNLSVTSGEVVALVGASGAGKSTLFKLLTGLLRPDRGEIKIDGQVAEGPSDQIAYVMQEDLLLPWRTVWENICLPDELGARKTGSRAERRRACLDLLDEMGLAGRADDYPEQLSGGMRHRVSLARAFFLNRPLLLLDEPFGSLDVMLREQLMGLLRDRRRRHGTTILMITHDFRDAMELSDRIVLLQRGQVVEQWGVDPETRNSPSRFGELYGQLRKSLKG